MNICAIIDFISRWIIMFNLKKALNNNPKISGATFFIMGALSLSWALKLLGGALFPPYILKFLTETSLLMYIGSVIFLILISYKLISRSYTILTPFLKWNWCNFHYWIGARKNPFIIPISLTKTKNKTLYNKNSYIESYPNYTWIIPKYKMNG